MQNPELAGHGYIASLDRVTKSYGNLRAITDITLGVRKGEIFGYIGPNGAGKTTTIKILVGLIKDYDGAMAIGSNGTASSRGRALGYLPQYAAFQEWRTVSQALTTFGKLSGMSTLSIKQRMSEVLELLGIPETKNRKIAQLSGGTIQKVGMAQAILHEPEFLVLDEPMAGLDPASRYQFKNVFRQLSREGTTILFSSHILSDVQDIASRIGIISRGRLMHAGTLDELKERLKIPKNIDVMLSKDSGRLKELERIKGVQSIERVEQGRYVVHLTSEADIDIAVDTLIRNLVDGGSKIRFINPVSLDLEDLYMRFVNQGEST